MNKQDNVTQSLAHTKWNCKYHVVFAPKYRRKVFFAEKRTGIREIIRQLCEWKGVEIVEGEICPEGRDRAAEQLAAEMNVISVIVAVIVVVVVMVRGFNYNHRIGEGMFKNSEYNLLQEQRILV